MSEKTLYTPQALLMILENAHAQTTQESKYDTTLLAISVLIEQGVRPETIIDAFSSMGLGYGHAFALEGSKYKYKQIRNRQPALDAWHQDNVHRNATAALN